MFWLFLTYLAAEAKLFITEMRPYMAPVVAGIVAAFFSRLMNKRPLEENSTLTEQSNELLRLSLNGRAPPKNEDREM